MRDVEEAYWYGLKQGGKSKCPPYLGRKLLSIWEAFLLLFLVMGEGRISPCEGLFAPFFLQMSITFSLCEGAFFVLMRAFFGLVCFPYKNFWGRLCLLVRIYIYLIIIVYCYNLLINTSSVQLN